MHAPVFATRIRRAVALLSCCVSTLVLADEFSNNTYLAISTSLTWHQARADAEARGGHLATITSQAELDHIISLGSLPSGPHWLGATDETQEGVWTWVTGEPWEFAFWSEGEPNNLGVENYLAGGTGTAGPYQWNDWGRVGLELPAYLLEIEACARHGAKASAEILNGTVVRIVISDPGCGYVYPPIVRFNGGGGTGADAVAEIANGRVTAIVIGSGGCCYTNPPTVLIASPPFNPTVAIAVSQIKVMLNVVLGRRYILESSNDLAGWNPVGEAFIAESEIIENVFDVNATGRFFRVKEQPLSISR